MQDRSEANRYTYVQARGQATEKHYAVNEVAELWNLSPKTIRRIFSAEPDVLVWGHPETLHKRAYTTLRILESVLTRVYRRLQSLHDIRSSSRLGKR